jgi:hypothetical protein
MFFCSLTPRASALDYILSLEEIMTENLYTLVDNNGNFIRNSAKNPMTFASREAARDAKRRVKKEAKIQRFVAYDTVR